MTSSDVYIVNKRGVYLHEHVLVTLSYSQAIACAERLAATQRDAHHSYEVFKLQLGVQVPLELDCFDCWGPVSSARVFRAEKNDD